MNDIEDITDKKLVQMVGLKIGRMGWADIRELKEIVDDEYNEREREFYERDKIR